MIKKQPLFITQQVQLNGIQCLVENLPHILNFVIQFTLQTTASVN